jgi:hypothetical protein
MFFKKFKFAAAALTVSAFMASPTVAATSYNYITNGGFEDNVGLSGNSWGVFNSIPGWTTTTGRGIEVQRGNIGGASPYEGQQKVELDSHNLTGGAANSNSNSGMQQALTLGAGMYEFSFAYLGRTDDAGTNGIGYSVMNGILNDMVTGIRQDGWTIITHMFTLDVETDVFVNFWAKGSEDTFGGYVDDVRLSAVPLPAALPLYGAGLAVMGLIGWRKRKAAASA